MPLAWFYVEWGRVEAEAYISCFVFHLLSIASQEHLSSKKYPTNSVFHLSNIFPLQFNLPESLSLKIAGIILSTLRKLRKSSLVRLEILCYYRKQHWVI